MRLNELLPGRALAPFRRRFNAVPAQNVADGLVRNVVIQVGRRSHDPIVSPARVFASHLDAQCLQCGRDSGPTGIAAMFRVGTQATCASAFRPSRLPISASMDLSELGKPNRAGRCARRIRFSAAKYSFCRQFLVHQAGHVCRQSQPLFVFHTEP